MSSGFRDTIMNHLLRYKTITLFFTIIILCFSQPVFAQPPKQSLQFSFGGMYLPMRGLSKNLVQESGGLGVYMLKTQKNNTNFYYAMSYIIPYNDRISINITLEYFSTVVLHNLFDPYSWSFSFECINIGYLKISMYRFHLVPISIGFEYKFKAFPEKFTPFAGIGSSLLWENICEKALYYSEKFSHNFDKYNYNKNMVNLGIYFSLGLQYGISESFYLKFQTRYRKTFSDKYFETIDINRYISFTSVDFNIGIGWIF